MRRLGMALFGIAILLAIECPAGSQPKPIGEIVVHIVNVDKARFAFARPGEKPSEPVVVRVGQLVTWVNLSTTTHALVSATKGRGDKPLFALADIPKKGKASFLFTEKVFFDAAGKPGVPLKLEYFSKNLPNTRGTIVLIGPPAPMPPPVDNNIADGHKAAQKRQWEDAVNAFKRAENAASKKGDKAAQGHAALQQGIHIGKWITPPKIPDKGQPKIIDLDKLKRMEFEAYQRAVDNLPQHTFDWELSCNNLGKIYLEKKDFRSAIEQFEKIQNPSRNNAHLLWTNLGEAYEGTGQLDKAYAKYLEALDIRPSADNSARRAFDLLMRKNGVPSKESSRLFKLLLRPDSPLLGMAGTEIPRFLANQKDQSSVEPLLQFYLVAHINPESFNKSERAKLQPLRDNPKWAPIVIGVERIFDRKQLAARKDPLFRSRAEVLEAFPGWEPQLTPGGDGQNSFSQLIRQVSAQYFEQSYLAKELPKKDKDEAARAAVVLASAAYWVDPRNSEAALLLASVLRLHGKNLDPEGRLITELATLLSKKDNPLYEAAKAPEDWQNIYAVHVVLGETYGKNKQWGKRGEILSAIGQLEQAASIERLRLKARPNPALQLALAEALSKGGFADPAAFHAWVATDRMVDAGVRVQDTASFKEIQRFVNASTAKSPFKQRVQNLEQVSNNLSEFKKVFHLRFKDFGLAVALDAEPKDQPLIWVATLGELLSYDARSGKPIQSEKAWWKPGVRTVAISPVGGWIASAEENAVTLGKGGGKHEKLAPMHKASVQTLAFSADGKWLAAGDARVVKVWNTTSRESTSTIEVGDGTLPYRLAISPDGSLIAVDRGADVMLFDAKKGEKRFTLKKGHKNQVSALAFGPGQVLATGDLTGVILLWDIAGPKDPEPRVLLQPTPVRALLFSPDGKMLLVSGDGAIVAANGAKLTQEQGGFARLYDVSTGREWARFRLDNWFLRPAFTANDSVLLGERFEPDSAGQIIRWQFPVPPR